MVAAMPAALVGVLAPADALPAVLGALCTTARCRSHKLTLQQVRIRMLSAAVCLHGL